MSVSQYGHVGSTSGSNAAVPTKAATTALAASATLSALGHQVASLDECALDVSWSSHHDLSVDGGNVEVAPVDADAVANFSEDGLLDSAGADVANASLGAHRGDGCLTFIIDCLQGIGSEVNLHGVLLPIGCPYLIGNIVNRHGDKIVVVDEHRRGEDEVELNRTAREGVVCVRG